ncbi:MAG: hypothetical protein IPJ94_19975 [Chloroflexi bacterium]|nr:hypothetical protein [Chloroflexota bacterium]
MQQIIDTIPEGLAVLDKNGLVTLVNFRGQVCAPYVAAVSGKSWKN